MCRFLHFVCCLNIICFKWMCISLQKRLATNIYAQYIPNTNKKRFQFTSLMESRFTAYTHSEGEKIPELEYILHLFCRTITLPSFLSSAHAKPAPRDPIRPHTKYKHASTMTPWCLYVHLVYLPTHVCFSLARICSVPVSYNSLTNIIRLWYYYIGVLIIKVRFCRCCCCCLYSPLIS